MFDNSLKRKKESRKSINKDYCLKRELLRINKIDFDFLEKIKTLTLEEIIFLKLDSAASGLRGKLYNFPIWKYSTDITKEAVLNYALSSTDSKKEASMVMGISRSELNRLIKFYNIEM